MRVLFDSDIVLDVSLKRKPSLEASAAAYSRAISEGEVRLAPHSFATIHYLNERYHGADFALSFSKKLLDSAQVCTFCHQDAVAALGFNSGDNEDALIIAAAVSGEADAIVTRNPADFKNSPVQILQPEDLLAL